MRRLIVALAFLTRLPTPAADVRSDDVANAIRLYPLVGAIIGAIVAGACWSGSLIDPWLGALAALVAWVAITGALHLDGLADTADGLGAAHGDRARLLKVMADPHVGSFGATVIVLQLAAKLVLLHLLTDQLVALVLIPFAARISPLPWARMLSPLKPDGLGHAAAGAVRSRDIFGWLAILGASALFVPALLAAPALFVLFAAWVRSRFGGITGDIHGAGIELIETGLLIAVLVAGRLGQS